MEAVYDGYISKYINRKASEPVARLLAKTRITPNHMSWAAFGIAVLSFISFIFGQNILGGLLAQLSSIVVFQTASLAFPPVGRRFRPRRTRLFFFGGRSLRILHRPP